MMHDYGTHKLTFGKHLPIEPSDMSLPLRVNRLATVRVLVANDVTKRFRRPIRSGSDSISSRHGQPLAAKEGSGRDRRLRSTALRLGQRRLP